MRTAKRVLAELSRHIPRPNFGTQNIMIKLLEKYFCTGAIRYGLYVTKQNQWCPFCKNKTSIKLYNWFVDNGFNVEREVTFDWCKRRNKLPFDFLINGIIIELDGDQHFKQVSNWPSHLIIARRDRYKEKKALENGYPVIRLLQGEVRTDITNEDGSIIWQDLLLESLAELRSKPDITLITTKGEWPGVSTNANIIKIEYETTTNFGSPQ
jgi:hypothetical protein